mmetsp:Transcript_12/g.17  ORF Transcript_12/g.17 Transcript_12/m.17 type:complete len:89 (+) Transcript_12:2206-2472(+)
MPMPAIPMETKPLAFSFAGVQQLLEYFKVLLSKSQHDTSMQLPRGMASQVVAVFWSTKRTSSYDQWAIITNQLTHNTSNRPYKIEVII